MLFEARKDLNYLFTKEISWRGAFLHFKFLSLTRTLQQINSPLFIKHAMFNYVLV